MAGCHTLIFTTLSPKNILPNTLSLKRRCFQPPPRSAGNPLILSSQLRLNLSNRILFVFPCRSLKGAPQGCLIAPCCAPAGGRRATLQENKTQPAPLAERPCSNIKAPASYGGWFCSRTLALPTGIFFFSFGRLSDETLPMETPSPSPSPATLILFTLILLMGGS